MEEIQIEKEVSRGMDIFKSIKKIEPKAPEVDGDKIAEKKEFKKKLNRKYKKFNRNQRRPVAPAILEPTEEQSKNSTC